MSKQTMQTDHDVRVRIILEQLRYLKINDNNPKQDLIIKIERLIEDELK